MGLEDARKHGAELALELRGLDELGLMERVLKELDTVYGIRDARGDLPDSLDDAAALVRGAEGLARADEHRTAHHMLRLAFTHAQLHLQAISQQRLQKLQEANAAPTPSEGDSLLNRSAYQGLRPEEVLRDVVGLYPRLEREARADGDDVRATRMADQSVLLLLGLPRVSETVLDVGNPDEPLPRIIKTELRLVLDEQDRASYRIAGNGGTSEDVTELPNVEAIDKNQRHSVIRTTLADTVDTIQGQEEFLSALLRRPEVQRAVGDEELDMRRLDQRTRVWEAIFPVLEREHENPLGALLRLMEQYFRVFTTHSLYNIRDLGDNYLDSELPRDYAGRIIQDCGVYALNTAYELSKVLARTRLSVELRLFSAIDHVMLTIYDKDRSEFYVLSNNQIRGPVPHVDGEARTGAAAPAQESMRSYAETFDKEFGFGTFIEIPLEDPRRAGERGDQRLKRSLWDRYHLATYWGFQPSAAEPDPAQSYTEDLKQFDLLNQQLHAKLVAITTDARVQRLAPDTEVELVAMGAQLLALYRRNEARKQTGGSHAVKAGHRRVGARGFFLASGPKGLAHPLTVLAGVLAAMGTGSTDARVLVEQLQVSPFAPR